MRKIVSVLILVLVLAITIVSLLSSRGKTYNWDTSFSESAMRGQPYDTDLFDEFMHRSVANGYLKKTLNNSDVIYMRYKDGKSNRISYEDYERITDNSFRDDSISGDDLYPTLLGLLEAPKDTALLVVKHNIWRVEYDDIEVMYTLYDFAKRGGSAVYITNDPFPYNHPKWISGDSVLRQLGSEYNYINDNLYIANEYSKEWLKRKEDIVTSIKDFDNKTIKLHNRFVYYRLNFEHLTHDKNVEVSFMGEDSLAYYAIRIKFLDTGGSLTISTLDLYFTNLGLLIPQGEKIIESVIDDVDNLPIMKIDYIYKGDHRRSSASIMRILDDSDGLHTAWYLVLGCIFLLLLGGLYRKMPVNRNILSKQDTSDVVAIRNDNFRKSPLFHFIFQCSWLYGAKTDHRDLFNNNFMRLSRIVKDYCGYELRSADPKQLTDIANILSKISTISAEKLRKEIQWMIDTEAIERDNSLLDSTPKITRDEFARSQHLVESLPFA